MLVLKTVINNLVALRGDLVVYCEQTISERTCFYRLFIFSLCIYSCFKVFLIARFLILIFP